MSTERELDAAVESDLREIRKILDELARFSSPQAEARAQALARTNQREFEIWEERRKKLLEQARQLVERVSQSAHGAEAVRQMVSRSLGPP
jgi:hypothetical protein